MSVGIKTEKISYTATCGPWPVTVFSGTHYGEERQWTNTGVRNVVLCDNPGGFMKW